MYSGRKKGDCEGLNNCTGLSADFITTHGLMLLIELTNHIVLFAKVYANDLAQAPSRKSLTPMLKAPPFLLYDLLLRWLLRIDDLPTIPPRPATRSGARRWSGTWTEPTMGKHGIGKPCVQLRRAMMKCTFIVKKESLSGSGSRDPQSIPAIIADANMNSGKLLVCTHEDDCDRGSEEDRHRGARQRFVKGQGGG